MKRLFAEIIAQFLGRPPKSAECPTSGNGCITLCYEILKALGKHPPASFGDLGFDDYHERIGGDLNLQRATLLALVNEVGREVPIERILPGDGLLIMNPNGLLPAIYCGQGKAVTSTPDRGVTVFAIDANNFIIAARRFE